MNVPPPPQNPPWTPAEKLELLTEIMKAANVNPDALVPFVQNLGYPRWDDMALPRGRSLNQCKQIYSEYVRPITPMGLSRSSSMRETPRPLDIPSTKRAYGMEEPSSAPMSGNRYQDIQPKPAGALGSILNPSPPGEPPKKKRGRPTKHESELRKEAARARGDSFVTMRREPPIQPGPSQIPSLATQAAQAVMTPPLQSLPKPTAPQETSSGKRKRMKQRSEMEGPTTESEYEEPTVQSETAPGPEQFPPQGTPSRYPDILSHHPDEGPSSFRAPRT